MKQIATLLVAATFAVTAVKMNAEPIPDDCKQGGFAIGCQAYTFRVFTVMEAIEKTAQAGGKVIEFFPGQVLSKEDPKVKWDHLATDEMIAKVKAKLDQHKVRAVNYGVVFGNDSNPTEEEWRKVFEFAKKLGLYAITAESEKSIDVIEKLVKEFDIRVGFHDHPKDEKRPEYKMWDPNHVLKLVEKRDMRIGSCADIGHWVRSGLKPADCLEILRGRIVSSHMKDLNEFGKRDAHDLPYGTGVSGIGDVLNAFKDQGFDGNISVEYEYNWENSVPEVAQCIGYVRGYGASKHW